MSGVDDLVTWLHAQLDEDERVAREAQLGDRGEWERGDRSPTGGTDVWDLNSRSDKPDRGFYRIADGLDPEVVDHIARHDPARVLAEVDAKRRIMAIHHPTKYEGMGGLPHVCDGCGYGGICDDPITEDINDCPILRALALPYADRPGYRDEWKP